MQIGDHVHFTAGEYINKEGRIVDINFDTYTLYVYLRPRTEKVTVRYVKMINIKSSQIISPKKPRTACTS